MDKHELLQWLLVSDDDIAIETSDDNEIIIRTGLQMTGDKISRMSSPKGDTLLSIVESIDDVELRDD
jgi:hypothetical protein